MFTSLAASSTCSLSPIRPKQQMTHSSSSPHSPSIATRYKWKDQNRSHYLSTDSAIKHTTLSGTQISNIQRPQQSKCNFNAFAISLPTTTTTTKPLTKTDLQTTKFITANLKRANYSLCKCNRVPLFLTRHQHKLQKQPLSCETINCDLLINNMAVTNTRKQNVKVNDRGQPTTNTSRLTQLSPSIIPQQQKQLLAAPLLSLS